MDSRIREIEQWLDEAKNDLQDGGREAYLRKLYLLDAEIRAVIKENDPLPEVSRASAASRPTRGFNLPLAVAGFAALVIFSSAVVLGQGNLRGTDTSRDLTSDLNAPSVVEGGLSLATMNRFPQGEQLVVFEDLPAVQHSGDANMDQHLASAGRDDASQTAAGSPQRESTMLASSQTAHRGLVGDVGDDMRTDYPVPQDRQDSQYTGIEVLQAVARDPQGSAAPDRTANVALPVDVPSYSSLPQTGSPEDGARLSFASSRFNLLPSGSDSSGVDPSGSRSGANGRSSEVLLSGNKGGTARDRKAERNVKLDEAELKKVINESLSKKETDKQSDS